MKGRFFSIIHRLVGVYLIFLLTPTFLFFLFAFNWRVEIEHQRLQHEMEKRAFWHQTQINGWLLFQKNILQTIASEKNLYNHPELLSHFALCAGVGAHLKLAPKDNLSFFSFSMKEQLITLTEPLKDNSQTLMLTLPAESLFLQLVPKSLKAYQQVLSIQPQESILPPQHVRLPIANSLFAIDIAYDDSFILHEIHLYFLELLLITCLAKAIIIGLILFVAVRFSRPLKQLFIVVDQVSQGNMQARFKEDPVGFEINRIGQMFNEMIIHWMEEIQVSKKERLSKEALIQEFRIARHIQMSILPEVPSVEGISLAAITVPAKQVGGDFYDVYLKTIASQQQQVVLTVGDIAGKGTSACLYTACLRSMLRSYQTERESLQEQLMLTNALFYEDAQSDNMFATTFTALYTPSTRQLLFASAGHPPAFVVRQGNIVTLEGKGLALGIFPELKIESHSFQMEPNDLLFIYTDGATDATNLQGEMFETPRILEFLKAHADLSCQTLINTFVNHLQQFSQRTAQFDDITILVMKIEK